MHTHAMLFIQDLAIIMLVAGFATLLCHQFKQPIVLGYIVAGMIVGSHTPPFAFISDEVTIKTLAELGVIFLMFSLGLEFNLHRLRKVGRTAVIAASLEIVLMVWLGYELGILFGWSQINALFLGAILSISSTTIIVKALNELGLQKESFAQVIFGILIIEDIFAILILALLSSIAISGTLSFNEIIMTATKLSSFLIVSLILGILLIPRFLSYVAKFKNNEVLLITVLGLCFGFCLLVAKLNYSVALGAFIIGAIISESNQLTKIEFLINPLRDMFSAIFFVSVGLLFNPVVVYEYFFSIVLITLVVVMGKIISCSLGVLITGYSGRTSMRVGMGLAQIGEFSFIIAALGISLKVTGDFLYSIAICVSIITTLITPYLIRYSDSFTDVVAKMLPSDLSTTFIMYSEWMKSIHLSHAQIKIRKVINRSIMQVLVNLFIVVAIFLVGTYLAKSELGSWVIQISNGYVQKSIIWASALVLSLPFLIAAYRKIKALSMILVELSVSGPFSSQFPYKIRSIISEIIPIIAMVIILFFISLLSVSILPPLELLFLIFIFVGILLVVIFPWFIKLHTKLHISLLEMLEKNKISDSEDDKHS